VQGESPLIRAAHNGHLGCVQFLLDEGCDVDALDMGDNTALHWASMRGHVEIVKVLCARGADRGSRNRQGKTPIDLCQPQWSNAWKYARGVLAAF